MFIGSRCILLPAWMTLRPEVLEGAVDLQQRRAVVAGRDQGHEQLGAQAVIPFKMMRAHGETHLQILMLSYIELAEPDGGLGRGEQLASGMRGGTCLRCPEEKWIRRARRRRVGRSVPCARPRCPRYCRALAER